jgi:hypothetical protein
MKDEKKVIAREHEYEFDDYETCVRCAVMIKALIDLPAEIGVALPKHITLEVFKNSNTLSVRTSPDGLAINFDMMVEKFMEYDAEFK